MWESTLKVDSNIAGCAMTGHNIENQVHDFPIEFNLDQILNSYI